MTRFWLKPILILMLLFTTISLIARALGSTQSPNPTLQGFVEGCDGKLLQCWYGIVSGETELSDVESLLKQSGYLRSYLPQYMQGEGINCKRVWINRRIYDSWIWPLDHTVTGLHFSQCQNIEFGEMILSLGTPDIIAPIPAATVAIYRKPYVMVILKSGNIHNWLRPNTPVIGFHVDQPHSFPMPATTGYHWHGFRPYTQYKVIEPEVRGTWYLGG